MSGREVRVICDREADTSTSTKRLDVQFLEAQILIRSLCMSKSCTCVTLMSLQEER